MASGIMSATNMVAENGAKIAYMKETFKNSSVFARTLTVKYDGEGLKYPVRGTDGGVVATMPAYNSGFAPSFSLASTSTEQAFKIGFSINISLASIVGKKASEEIAMQVNDGLINASSVFDNNMLYGSGNGTSGFKGLHARLATGTDWVIKASDSTASVSSSAYAIVDGDFDSHLYIPAGLDLDSPTALTITEGTVDASGNAMAGKTATLESYIGFVVHANTLPPIGQIYRLNATDKMTYTLFVSLYNAMSLDINNRASRTTIYMSPAQFALFSKDCGSLISTVQTMENIGLRVAEVDGVKIVSTSRISNAESNKA